MKILRFAESNDAAAAKLHKLKHFAKRTFSITSH